MGNENAVSLGRLQEETQSGMYDVLIHNGDFAYDMENVNFRLFKATPLSLQIFLNSQF
jgi:hypothetical protein